MVHNTIPYRRQSCLTQVLDLDKVTVRVRGQKIALWKESNTESSVPSRFTETTVLIDIIRVQLRLIIDRLQFVQFSR